MLGVTKQSESAGDVALVDWPEPDARPGHVVLEVLSAGICGTDLHIFRNEYASNPPVVLGHEVCGRVVRTGEGVDPGLQARRFVAETFFATCGACAHCRDGRPNLCRQRRSIGSHVNGAMTDLVEVPVRNLHEVPENIGDAAASLAEPLACVMNSLFGETSHIEPGQKVLVIGPGAIGLIAAQVAGVQGAEVTLRGTEADTARLQLARQIGFETSTVGDVLPEESFDVVVECSGNGHGYADALNFACRAGRIAQMGLGGKPATLPTDLICYKELTITSGFASTPRSWKRAMRLMHGDSLTLEPLVTDVMPVRAWEKAFDHSFNADGVKFVLAPGD